MAITYKTRGGEVVTVTPPPKPKRKYAPAVPDGYADTPGTGPSGETCRTCQHATKNSGWDKNYWKCGLMRRYWSHSYGTDIRLKSPACRHWEGKKDEK